ncbi:MAG: FG-GAP repeat domain-containing protein [Gammaproteobacteria bacterium]
MTAFLVFLFTAGTGQNALACADIDGDGQHDLLVANEKHGNLVVWLGDGDGELRRHFETPVADNPADLAIADIDADGNPDVVIAHHERDQISILGGDGTGAFNLTGTFAPGVNPHPHVVEIADINGNGKLAILVDDRANGGLRVFTADRSDPWVSNATAIDLGGDPYLGFALGDVNADGFADVAAPVKGQVTVALIDKDGATLIPVGEQTYAFAAALLDSNGDGHLDLVSASSRTRAAQRFLGDGSGAFKSLTETAPLPAGAKKIAVGDLDGDGAQEAVIVNWSGGVTILANDQTFDTTRYDNIPHPWGLAVCDLNHDGADDVIVTDGESDDTGVYPGKRK